MSENNIIKSITIHKCPHCQEEFYIESQMAPSTISSVFTRKDIDEAKKDCKERVESLSIDDEKKAQVIKWLEDDETIFGPDEVESIILSLLKPE